MDFLNQSSVRMMPCGPLTGQLSLPGSKSITNRALLLAGLADGQSRLIQALASDDTRYMSQALRQMGATVESPSDTEFLVTGGNGNLSAPEDPIFLGNAGTATRFLTAAVATQTGRFVVTGDEHMQKRPIIPLVEALQRLGVDAKSETGCPPVEILGSGGFTKDSVEIDGGLSSQYISAILMAAPLHERTFELSLSGTEIGAKGYIDITLSVMRAFGAEVDQLSDGRWRVEATGYRAVDTYQIEPDASAATYLWAAEVLTNGKIDLGVAPADMMQPDAAAWNYINQWPNLPAVINGSQMQDAIPTLAVIAAFNNTSVRFTGIENLRVKECDRIHACCADLNKLKPGIAEEQVDDLVIQSDPELSKLTATAPIETYADHRIAMAFALAGLVMPGVEILDPGCVAKTYPNYWRDLQSLGVEI